MYFLYILKSERVQKSYVGITDNLFRRLKEHNSGKHFYTKRHLPWKIIYTEKFKTKREARDKELYYKTTTGRRLMKNMFV